MSAAKADKSGRQNAVRIFFIVLALVLAPAFLGGCYAGSGLLLIPLGVSFLFLIVQWLVSRHIRYTDAIIFFILLFIIGIPATNSASSFCGNIQAIKSEKAFVDGCAILRNSSCVSSRTNKIMTDYILPGKSSAATLLDICMTRNPTQMDANSPEISCAKLCGCSV